jgi:hypothetical protein
MNAFVARGVTLGKGHKRQLCPWYIQNFMSSRSFEFFNNFSNTNILYCFHGAFELTPYVSHKIRLSL